MDNIIFEKIWQDSNLIELKISAYSEYVKVYQNCYIEEEALNIISDKIGDYVNDYTTERYLEFGNKGKEYTPAFSMRILSADISGRVKIEVDFEIDDNDMKLHRCMFYVESELGLVDKLGKMLKCLISSKVGTEVSLC